MKRSGFTLLELLLVIGILMLLMGLIFVGLNVVRVRGRELQARRDIDQIKTALHAYLSDYGELPDGIEETGTDFVKVMRGEKVGEANPRKFTYMDFHEKKKGMMDPWKNFYGIAPDDVNQSVRIWSNGQDGTPGTADDIKNWRE